MTAPYGVGERADLATDAPTRVRTQIGVTVFGCETDEAALFRRLSPRYDVVPTIVGEPIGESTLHLASGNRCISVGHKTPITGPMLEALSRHGVRYISTRSVGFDHIDVDHAARVGITAGNVAYSPDGVADYTVMLMLMALRHAQETLRRTGVHDYRIGPARGRELRDLTVGVVGTGRIGSAVIDRLRGFRCRILAHDSRATARATYVDLDTLLHESDIVTLHIPLTEQNHHLIDAGRIDRMRPGARIVNTGRGGLVDTAALVAALESGRLAGAALDVVEGEDGIFYTDRRSTPVQDDLFLRLHGLPSVLLTPHTAYYTDHALRDTVENTLINCLTHEGGHPHG